MGTEQKKKRIINWWWVALTMLAPLIVLGLYFLLVLVQIQPGLRYDPAYFTPEHIDRYFSDSRTAQGPLQTAGGLYPHLCLCSRLLGRCRQARSALADLAGVRRLR